MTLEPDDLDHRLRAAFEPSPDSVSRVVEAAASGRGTSHRFGLRPALVSLGVVGLVALAGAGFWARGHLEAPRVPPAASPGLAAWFDDEVLVVSESDGSVSLVGPGGRDERPSDGEGIVLVLGEGQ
jgi:hypothetical protein